MESIDNIDEKKVYDCLVKAGLKDKIDSLEKGNRIDRIIYEINNK